jgi:uncharacterized LabA/DUF88 family protein
MKEKCVILVDNSNIFIGGRQLAGQAQEDLDRDIDPGWRIDFGALIEVLAKGRKVERALLVGSRPPFADAVWVAAEREGFEVIVHDRNAQGKEKGIDTELVARGTEIVCLAEEPMVLVIASGDGDLLPLVNLAQDYGWTVEMCAFTNSYSPESELCLSCNEVRPLDEHLETLGRRQDQDSTDNDKKEAA